MSTQITIETFENFYNNTYKQVLKYTIYLCRDLDDVNDIIQDIYTELYERVKKKRHIELDNEEAYIIAVASKKAKKYHSMKKKIHKKGSNLLDIETIADDNFNIEENLITKDNVEQVWKFLKSKGEITLKIFYLFYVLDVSIKDISNGLKINESNVKNHLYRTQKDLKKLFGKEKKESC